MAAPAIPNEPIVDPKTGQITPAWRQFFNELRRILESLGG